MTTPEPTPRRVAFWHAHLPQCDPVCVLDSLGRGTAVAALDVERLARAIKYIGRWRGHQPGGIQDERAYAAILAAAYDKEGQG